MSFDPSGTHLVAEAEFHYHGFALTDMIIEDYMHQDTGGKSTFCRLEGSLVFRDAIGRRAFSHYVVDYDLYRDRIVILNSVVVPVSPLFPPVQAYIIKAEELQGVDGRYPDFVKFYVDVVTRAQNMAPTPEEIRLRRDRDNMSLLERIRRMPVVERLDYYVVIFVMDRLRPDDEIKTVVSGSRISGGSYGRSSLAEPIYQDMDGWRVAMFEGNFAIDHDMFYVHTFYRPTGISLPGGRDEVLIGLFTPEKNYDVHEAPVSTKSSPAGGKTASAEGPLALGSTALDISLHDHAAVVQGRLAKLGFYKKSIDGLWGSGSRGALQDFQRANGLDPNSGWNMQTQMKLFSGSGQ